MQYDLSKDPDDIQWYELDLRHDYTYTVTPSNQTGTVGDNESSSSAPAATPRSGISTARSRNANALAGITNTLDGTWSIETDANGVSQRLKLAYRNTSVSCEKKERKERVGEGNVLDKDAAGDADNEPGREKEDGVGEEEKEEEGMEMYSVYSFAPCAQYAASFLYQSGEGVLADTHRLCKDVGYPDLFSLSYFPSSLVRMHF